MRHGDIIKKINSLFINEFETFMLGKWEGNVRLDSTEEVTDKEPYISINYSPHMSSQRYLHPRDYNLGGDLRVYFYEKNKTKSMEILDLILEFLKDNTINELKYTELPGLASPWRESAGDLYVGFVDFDVCLVH